MTNDEDNWSNFPKAPESKKRMITIARFRFPTKVEILKAGFSFFFRNSNQRSREKAENQGG